MNEKCRRRRGWVLRREQAQKNTSLCPMMRRGAHGPPKKERHNCRLDFAAIFMVTCSVVAAFHPEPLFPVSHSHCFVQSLRPLRRSRKVLYHSGLSQIALIGKDQNYCKAKATILMGASSLSLGGIRSKETRSSSLQSNGKRNHSMAVADRLLKTHDEMSNINERRGESIFMEASSPFESIEGQHGRKQLVRTVVEESTPSMKKSDIRISKNASRNDDNNKSSGFSSKVSETRPNVPGGSTSQKHGGPRTTTRSSRSSALKYRKRDPPNLQRYYKTELLTSEEEYVLGMRVKLMVQCEAVHEGLRLFLDRVPSLEEWANACGYFESDPPSVLSNIDSSIIRSIRPTGSSTLRQDKDPNMFVGSGLAGGAGVGRGNGRAKKAPPVRLDQFWDDSNVKFYKQRKGKRPKGEASEDDGATPILMNQGTTKDFIEMMSRGREAKQRMIQCNMRLAVSIAKRYRNVGVNIADLVQEGSIGLARAAEKFDPKRGFKFSTYASWWIQQAVFRSIAYHSRTIRLPVHIHNLLNRVRRIRQVLQQELGRPPTNEEIAEKLGMPAEKYSKIIRLTRRSISLEMPKYQNNPKDVGQESEKLVLDTIDSTAVSDENRPERSVDQKLFQSDLREMLKILEEDERRVICARYGLDDGMTRTVTAVAAQFRQPKSWVRSQECRALRKLRRPWYEKRLYEHMLSSLEREAQQ